MHYRKAEHINFLPSALPCTLLSMTDEQKHPQQREQSLSQLSCHWQNSVMQKKYKFFGMGESR